MRNACLAWVAFFVFAAMPGCASEGNGSQDAFEDDTDTRPRDVLVADDESIDLAPDLSEDFGEEVFEVIPDTAPDPVSDVEDAVEEEEPLPNRCNRDGERDCSPGPGGGYCPDGPSEFRGDVNAAIDETIATHPEWFDTSVTGPAIHAENVNDYMQSVTDILYSRGLCASGPGEELNVKFNNDCCEAWDIVATPSDTEWLVRRYYVGNCLPSFF